ncbi:hypothetical protein K1T71_003590 [Dendrolimus kikuchii]|uniref:Uncharacterized protein n=1 Tax=Dendrolimus kikuchii TaxID=765133 RepID=A0ACC1DCF8_9NEOP|nr:hypothetical protein K1T71_003590 [Dendrolimus kikuchii]
MIAVVWKSSQSRWKGNKVSSDQVFPGWVVQRVACKWRQACIRRGSCSMPAVALCLALLLAAQHSAHGQESIVDNVELIGERSLFGPLTNQFDIIYLNITYKLQKLT